jgi:hypothetical protein
MAKIVQADREGAPTGVYDVAYFTVRGGVVTRDAGEDSGVSLNYIEKLSPGANEIAYATCRSQRGGVTVYGSADAKRVFDDSRFA